MNRDELITKNRDELLEICTKLNIKPHPKAKDSTLIEKILAQPVAYQTDAMQHVAQRKVEPEHHNTPEQVKEAISKFMEKEGFEAKFDMEYNTVKFSYRKREETVNLSIPLRIIRQKAENVSRGPLLPPMDKDGNGKFLWAAR